MDPERWQRIKTIFEAASLLPVHERAACVRTAAGFDAELAAEIEALLSECEDLGDFLEPPDEVGGLRAGDVVGGFTLRSKLGQGGMGIVWLAEQENPRRHVALKLLQPAALSSDGVRRFRREAELLARLSHPFIAQVYEAGTDEREGLRRPWFALELVDGRPIDAHARDLAVSARIELFVKVCDALQHAHERGIVHRDLKPANILVTAAGDPKVLDFGIGRAIGLDADLPTLQTRTGLLLGTLDYMSPEQLAGGAEAVDARADVYALGVVLHELLAGRRPYAIAGRSLPEALRILSQDEPTAISTWDRQLRGDLETIVAKALEKDRARRYASAADLALDLRRFLREEPIAARPASTVYQLRKFARRNKALVAGVAIAFLALAAGTAVATWQAVEAGRGRERAESEAVRAREAGGFLSDMLMAIDPEVAEGRDTSLFVEMLARAEKRLADHRGDPRVEGELRQTIGSLYFSLGRLAEAEPHLQRAVELRRERGAEAAAELVASLHKLGGLLTQAGRFAEAERSLREAIDIDISRGSAAARDLALDTGSLGALCFARAQQAATRADRDADLAEGARQLDLALETWRAVPDATGYEIARTLRDRALIDMVRGDKVAAQRGLEESLVHLQDAAGPQRRALATIHYQLGQLAIARNDLDVAERETEAALTTYRQLFGDDHASVATTLGGLSLIARQRGDIARAEATCRESVAIRRKLSDDPTLLADGLCRLGGLLEAQGQNAEAALAHAEAAQIYVREKGAAHPWSGIALSYQGRALLHDRRPAEAIAPLEESRASFAGSEQADRLRGTLELLVESYVATGDDARAETCRTALEALPKSPAR